MMGLYFQSPRHVLKWDLRKQCWMVQRTQCLERDGIPPFHGSSGGLNSLSSTLFFLLPHSSLLLLTPLRGFSSSLRCDNQQLGPDTSLFQSPSGSCAVGCVGVHWRPWALVEVLVSSCDLVELSCDLSKSMPHYPKFNSSYEKGPARLWNFLYSFLAWMLCSVFSDFQKSHGVCDFCLYYLLVL